MYCIVLYCIVNDNYDRLEMNLRNISFQIIQHEIITLMSLVHIFHLYALYHPEDKNDHTENLNMTGIIAISGYIALLPITSDHGGGK